MVSERISNPVSWSNGYQGQGDCNGDPVVATIFLNSVVETSLRGRSLSLVDPQFSKRITTMRLIFAYKLYNVN